ncbi:hypothetical protein J7L36_02100 [bacterium]|nr:hypothetical protein [bacterium]
MTEYQFNYWCAYQFPDPPIAYKEFHSQVNSFTYEWKPGDHSYILFYNPSPNPSYLDRVRLYGGNPATHWMLLPYKTTAPAALGIAGLGIAMMAGGAVIAVVLGREEVVPQPPSEPQTGGPPGEPRGGPPSEGPQEWT